MLMLLKICLLFFTLLLITFIIIVNNDHNYYYELCSQHALSVNPSVDDAQCWVFSEYKASDLEQKWVKNIHKLQSVDSRWVKGCKEAQKDKPRLQQWISDILYDRKVNKHERYEFNKTIFSHFKYINKCNNEIVYKYIEPLAVYLRYPISGPCFNEKNLLNKDYLLVQKSSDVLIKGKKKFLFDLGCSSYKQGWGGPSLSWFVETYLDRGIDFDRILGWEMQAINHKNFWSIVPLKVKAKFSFFNIGANPNGNSSDNPLHLISELATKDDFVVLKVDIDNNEVENKFIQQILNNATLAQLIDELYWENHVIGNPVARNWGLSNYKNLSAYQNLSTSYNLFNRLRHMGIVAHSWV